MISRLFDNDETFVERFLDYWEAYRALPAGRDEKMLKQMVYFHNCLYPDFAMSECTNCGSRWKRGEYRLDFAYSILVAERKENEVSDTPVSNKVESEPQTLQIEPNEIIEEPVKPVRKSRSRKIK